MGGSAQVYRYEQREAGARHRSACCKEFAPKYRVYRPVPEGLAAFPYVLELALAHASITYRQNMQDKGRFLVACNLIVCGRAL